MAERRLAVVTGAARGIGRAIVFELLQQGRLVAGLDISENQLKELEVAARQAGFELLTRCLDITDTPKLTEILALHTGQEFDRVKRDTERDYYMPANEFVAQLMGDPEINLLACDLAKDGDGYSLAWREAPHLPTAVTVGSALTRLEHVTGWFATAVRSAR